MHEPISDLAVTEKLLLGFRGGKVSDFEGGVRVVAFMSGGGLPQGLAGGKRTGMMHIADIHATICKPLSLTHAHPGSDF